MPRMRCIVHLYCTERVYETPGLPLPLLSLYSRNGSIPPEVYNGLTNSFSIYQDNIYSTHNIVRIFRINFRSEVSVSLFSSS